MAFDTRTVDARPPGRHLQIYMIAIALCLFNLLTTGLIAVSNDKTFNDALKYYDTAANLYQGQGFTRQYKDDVADPNLTPPFPVSGRALFPILMSRAFQIFGSTVHTANAVSALFKALLVIPIFGLAFWFFGFPAAVLAGLLYSFNPFYFDMGVRSMPETTLSFLFYLGLLLLVIYVDRRRYGLVLLPLAGLAAALAYLTRAEGLLLALLGSLLIWLYSPRKRDVLLFLAVPVFTLVFGSLLIYGRVAGMDHSATSLATLPTWWDAYSLDRHGWGTYFQRVGGLWGAAQIRLYNFVRFTKNVFSDGLIVDTQTGLLPLLFLPLLAVPLFLTRGGRRRSMVRLITVFMVLGTALTLAYPGYPALSTEVRHGQIIAPWLLVLAGGGLAQLWMSARPSWQNRGPNAGRLAAAILLSTYAIFSAIFLTVLVNFFLWVPPYRGGVEQGAEWARGELPRNAVLMSRRVTDTAFFSQRNAVVTPTAPFAAIMEYARRQGVTHILIADQDRQAVPNLVRGLDLFPANFARLHTAPSFQLVAVQNYAFSDGAPRVSEDAAVLNGQNAPPTLDWAELAVLRPQNSLKTALEDWRQWASRARTGVLAISHQYPRARRISEPAAFRFGDKIMLKGYDLAADTLGPGKTAHLTLYWQPIGPMEEDYTVFTHVLGPDGRVYGQADGQPLDGEYPTSRWAGDGTIQDEYDIQVPANSPPGHYQVEAGMYLLSTGKRLPVTAADGQRQADDHVLLDAAD